MENLEKNNFKPENQEEKESREERIKEIDDFVDEYFQKYKVGYEASGVGSTQGTELSFAWWEMIDSEGYSYDEEISTLLKERLSGKRLVDLGVGNSYRNIPYNTHIPVKEYVAVDIDIDMEDINNRDIKGKFEEQGIESSFIKGDMLKFVARLPSGSSNFFLGAIDPDVILDRKYWQYLCEEIYRTTEEKGVVIETPFDGMGYQFDKYLKGKFKKIADGIGYISTNILEKQD